MTLVARPDGALRSRIPHGPTMVGPLLAGPLLAWAALFWNVMPFLGASALPIPGALGQLVSQSMLPAALLLALMANPRAIIRPNLVLSLLTAMAVLSLVAGLHNEYLLGSTYRSLRFIGFVMVLWLLSAWWGRPDLVLLRAHLLCLRATLVLVALGAVVFPGTAFNEQGRLVGAIWPIQATQVGHYAAVAIGCTLILWFCGMASGYGTLVTLAGGGGILLLSHTRTALAGLVIGVLLASASLFLGQARVRRTAAVVSTLVVMAGIPLGSAIVAWLGRGEGDENTLTLTGRTKVWTRILDEDRTPLENVFGIGLTNKSYDGLPIDSSWLATYWELGWAGISIQIAVLATLLLMAIRRPRGPRRGIALFLVSYCFVASFTETGLGDASPYLLELCVAAAALTPTAGRASYRAPDDVA